MANLKACSEAPNGDIITPQGRMAYAYNAFKGQPNDAGDLRYQLSVIFPPDADLKMLKKKMYDIALEKLKDEKKAKAAVNQRFMDPVEKNQDAELFDGWTLLRCSSPSRPGFIFANGKECPSDDFDQEIYSGRWARISVNPFWFEAKKNGAVINKGVTCGLQNVQLLQHDDPIGSSKPRAGDQFEAVSDDDGGSVDSADDIFADDD